MPAEDWQVPITMLNWIQHLRHRPRIPDDLWHACIRRLPFLHRLKQDELARLKPLCERFFASKTMTGADGFELTDDIALLIAVQACLPVLNLTLALYDDMPGVIIYPAEFIVPQSETDEAGVVHEWAEPLCGEAVDAGGVVVLSAQDVSYPATSSHNVVIHEFAHKIDMASGIANGCPPFLHRWHRGLDERQWQQAFTEAYEDFSSRTEAWERGLLAHADTFCDEPAFQCDKGNESLPMDPYAATNPAEFFAVASEVFFVRPQPLVRAYPKVFDLLSRYYLQETL